MDKKFEDVRGENSQAEPVNVGEKPVFIPTGNVEVIDYSPQSVSSNTTTEGAPGTGSQVKSNKIVAFFKKYPWALPVSALLIIALVGGVAWALFSAKPTAVNNKVSVIVEAPKEVPIGSTREWMITVKNNNSVSIMDTRAVLVLDQNFKYQRDTSTNASFDQKSTTYFLRELKPDESKVIKFEAQILGAIQETSTLQVKVQFNPQTTTTPQTLEVLSDKYTTTIVSSDIRAEIQKDQALVEVGSEAKVAFQFENISDKDIENIRVRVRLPEEGSFSYRSSQLDQGVLGVNTKPTESNTTWVIPKLPRKTTFVLTVNGTIPAGAKTEIPFTFEIASLSAEKEWKKIVEKSDTLKSTPQSLAVTTYINGVQEFFKPSATVEVVVEYENKSTKSLNNLEIASTINDPANILDYSKLNILTGNPSITNKRLVWKGAALPELATVGPGAKGIIRYQVPVKSLELALNSSLEQERYTLQPIAEVKQDQQTISAVSLVVYKMQGSISFVQKAQEIKDVSQTVFRNDGGSFKVVRVTWEIGTVQNKISNLEVRTSTNLITNSGGFNSTDSIFNPQSIVPADYLDKLLYNENTGEIVLSQPTLDNYLGVSKSKLVITFDIKVPSTSAVNGNYNAVTVLNKTTLKATDDITKENYKIEVGSLNFSSTQSKP